MMFSPKVYFNKIQSKLIANRLRENSIITIVAFLIIIPVFIFFRKNIYYTNNLFPFDAILIFIVLFFLLFIILKKLNQFLIYTILIYFTVFTFTAIQGNYSVSKVIDAYKIILESNDIEKETISEKNILIPFPNKNKVYESVDYMNPKIRNFALFSINKHFTKISNYSINRKFIQYFAVFKEINKRWNYVNDPKEQEYFAKGSESLLYFSGDCDDHAILMCSAIKSIGGSMRLIHTGKHMYPELLIGKEKDLEVATYLISNVLFEKESKNKTIFFHRAENGKIWLNLDYTAKHPGGPFLGEDVISILNLQE